jgi:hypothetical protein
MMTSPVRMPAGPAGPLASMPAMSADAAEAEALGDLGGHLLDAHAEPAAPRLAEFAQLRDDRPGGIGRHREGDADIAAGLREDRRVDADDVAGHVEQGAAGIAAVNGGIGLDVIVEGTGLDVAVLGRDDAGRHRAAEAERVADGHHRLADADLVGIGEVDRLQGPRRLDAQHRHVDLAVAADQLGGQPGAVIEDDGDLVGAVDDVVVGDDDAGGIDHKARAERGLAALRLLLLAVGAGRAGTAGRVLAAAAEEFLEQFVEGGAGAGPGIGAAGRAGRPAGLAGAGTGGGVDARRG